MLLLNNVWHQGHGSAFSSYNPADGSSIWHGHAADSAQVAAAITAAQLAQPSWADTSFTERAAWLQRFAQRLATRREAFAHAIARETGKPLWDSEGEVSAMLSKITLSLQAYQQRTPTQLSTQAGLTTRLSHRPHGVVAVFGPYNFPGHLPNGHIIPALLAGNCVVFKPSEFTPAVAELYTHLWLEADLPPGVFNLVQGGRATGSALAQHPGINGLFFTGSAATGKALHKQFAGQPGKILALEMGGNNPLIVDTEYIEDLAAAAYHTIQSAYLSSGQRCTCARRLIVIESARTEEFLQQLLLWMDKIQVGAWNAQPQPFMGPVIHQTSAAHLLQAQAHLLTNGARVMRLMQALHPQQPFLSPGLIDVTAMLKRPDEEYFGPLLQLIRVPSFETALEEANRTAYGLSASLLSDHQQHYQQFYRCIRAGIVNWNRPTTGASSALPFGGIGDSGNLRPSAFYAADYCAYPIASQEAPKVELPAQRSPGLD